MTSKLESPAKQERFRRYKKARAFSWQPSTTRWSRKQIILRKELANQELWAHQNCKKTVINQKTVKSANMWTRIAEQKASNIRKKAVVNKRTIKPAIMRTSIACKQNANDTCKRMKDQQITIVERRKVSQPTRRSAVWSARRITIPQPPTWNTSQIIKQQPLIEIKRKWEQESWRILNDNHKYFLSHHQKMSDDEQKNPTCQTGQN